MAVGPTEDDVEEAACGLETNSSGLVFEVDEWDDSVGSDSSSRSAMRYVVNVFYRTRKTTKICT